MHYTSAFQRNLEGLPLKWGLRLAGLIAFAAGWQLIAVRLDSLLLPSFTETAAALASMLAGPELWQALWISNQAMVLGFASATLLGVPLGLALGRWRTVERFADPYVSILLVLPKAALIPILIMAAGLGLFSRVLIVFLFAFVVIVVNTRAGLRMIEPAWIDMARSFGAREVQLWSKVLLRGAMPAVLTGLRLGLIRSVSGMVTAELLLLALGIGRLILNFQGAFRAADLYATIFVVIAEAVVLLQAFKWLEARLSGWSAQAVIE
jgi:NitT/TauT family transport system permease protein